uniref:Uncharacterized protein n=1 Tax=Oryzias sinensis TaxID=183150 RepID=A0A8C7ZS74_9TELE
MHHQDLSGESSGSGSRKTSFHFRRGSSGAPASPAAAAGGGGTPAEDSPAQAGSSSPALHHQSQGPGTQMKKKSGFQITSVTSAQISRPVALDNSKVVAGQQITPLVGTSAETNIKGGVCIPGSSTGPAAPSTLSGLEPGQPASSAAAGPGPAHGTQTQHIHTQTATGSRFRVVKLDTNSEPIRKGRWTCTEYYEKEIPHAAPSEGPKAAETGAEPEVGNAGISPAIPAVQPLHNLQPYQPQGQDFTSPQAMQSPPQAPQTAPLICTGSQVVLPKSKWSTLLCY